MFSGILSIVSKIVIKLFNINSLVWEFQWFSIKDRVNVLYTMGAYGFFWAPNYVNNLNYRLKAIYNKDKDLSRVAFPNKLTNWVALYS